MKQIREWLEKGQDYAVGLALYESHGSSRVVLTALRRGASEFTRQKLREELTKLVKQTLGVVDKQKPTQLAPAAVSSPVAAKPAAQVAKLALPADEALRLQRSSWYAERHRLHATLELLATDEERRGASERILDLSERLTASYQAASQVPVGTPRPDLGALTDEGEIRRLLANLRPQVCKLKKNPARALDLQQARADITLLEIKLRKP